MGKICVGVFTQHQAAESAVRKLRSLGLSERRISVLRPGSSERQVGIQAPTVEAEQPGMGPAVGAVAGGALGAASGLSLGRPPPAS